LGGDPLSPNTYIADSHGRIAKIVRTDNGYALAKASLPTAEVSGLWIDAVVPMELHNNGKFLVWTPKITLRPSLNDLAAVIGWVNTNLAPETKVKAAGSRHSRSDVATTMDVYISPENLKLLRTIDEDPSVYQPDASARLSMLVRGGSGSTVIEMNKFLWEHGKSFRSLGAYDGQTLGGVFNTSTHGSCFTSLHLGEVIVSIDLILGNGTINRIEPTNGITDVNLLRS
jgi:FAD/FMN-containing dehydrogenase